MKKFIICVALGYALIFFLFIGMPDRAGRIEKGLGSGPDAAAPEPSAGSAETPRNSASGKSAVVPDAEPDLQQLVADKENLVPYETGPIETFYKHGALSSEWVQESSEDGLLKTYTPEGQSWMNVSFARKVPEGDFAAFYPEGNLLFKQRYEAGERRGPFIWQHRNGKPWFEIVWDAQGRVLMKGLHSGDGKRIDLPAARADSAPGYFNAFDEQGREAVHVRQAGSEQHIVLKSYDAAGMMSVEVNLRRQSLDGRITSYDSEAVVWLQMEFRDAGAAGVDEGAEPGKSGFSTDGFMERALPAEVDYTIYYPGGELFWQLIKTFNQDRVSVFQLTVRGQGETAETQTNERVLL